MDTHVQIPEAALFTERDRPSAVRRIADSDLDPVSLAAWNATGDARSRVRTLLAASNIKEEDARKARQWYLDAEGLAESENHLDAAKQYRRCSLVSKECGGKVRNRVLEPILADVLANNGSIRP